MTGWYYKGTAGEWIAYPGSSAIPSLAVSPQDPCFYNDTATIRVETDDVAVYDLYSIVKIRSGDTAKRAFLSDELISFNGDSRGRVATTSTSVRIIAYDGSEHVLPRIGTITGAPSGMDVSVGDPAGYDLPITIEVSPNATLGGDGATSGTILIPVTSPLSTTLSLQWVKLVSGYTIDVANIDITYQLGTSLTTKPAGIWDVEFPENVSENSIVWVKAGIEYDDKSATDSYSTVLVTDMDASPATGQVVDHVVQHYLRSHDGEGIDRSTAGWDTEMPQPTAYMSYLWNYQTFYYVNGEHGDSEPVVICEYNGDAGDVKDVHYYYATVSELPATDQGDEEPADEPAEQEIEYTDAPSLISMESPYILSYVTVTYEDDSAVSTDPMVAVAYSAEDRRIVEIKEYYAASSSNTIAPARWSEDVDDALAKISGAAPYLWTYETIVYNTSDTATGETETYDNIKRVIAIYGNDDNTYASFHLITPDGDTFLAGVSSLPIQATAYLGTADVVLNGTCVWETYNAGKWLPLLETGTVLTVNVPEAAGIQVFRCRFTYGKREYVDIATLNNRSGEYNVSVESSAGAVFKNGLGNATLLGRVWQDSELDDDGTMFKYIWYRLDLAGKSLDGSTPFALTKAVSVVADNVEEQTLFVCEIYDGDALLGRGDLLMRDEDDIIISPTEPIAKSEGMLWLDTSVSASGILKQWDGKRWVTTNLSQSQMMAILRRTVASHSSQINQMDDEIRLRVTQENYEAGLTGTENWVSQNYTTLSQTAENIDMVYRETTNYTDGYRTYVENYMRFNENGLELGKSDSPFKTKLSNEKLSFEQDDEEVAYIDRNALYITDARVTSTLSVGDIGEGWFDWQMTSSGLGMKWKEPGVY